MQGVHAFDPKVKTSIDLESFVAADHYLRRIDRVLDLSFIRELTAARYADGQGRPSIDPEVYFRMQLVAYFNGITKDRRPRNARCDLLEQFQPFRTQAVFEIREPGGVAAWPRKAIDETTADRVNDLHKYDRHGAGRL